MSNLNCICRPAEVLIGNFEPLKFSDCGFRHQGFGMFKSFDALANSIKNVVNQCSTPFFSVG